MHTPLFLGIDGGASKTVALLARADGSILARAQVGGSNKQVSGVEATLNALHQVVQAVFNAAGLPMQPVVAACLGLSGVDRPEDLVLIRGWSEERRLCEGLVVVNDARLVIAAGTPQGHGIGLICGTGSIAIGRSADGRMARAGGWGYILGDEGSGYDIALRALRAATQAADGRGPAQGILAALLEQWGRQEPFELIPYVYNQGDPRASLSELPPLIGRLAENGDEDAAKILDQAGEDLAAMVLAAAEQLEMEGPLPVALAGSVILRTPRLRRALVNAIERRGHRAEPVTPVEEPAYGALRLAHQHHTGYIQ